MTHDALLGAECMNEQVLRDSRFAKAQYQLKGTFTLRRKILPVGRCIVVFARDR
jgi:hypothetical protein